MKPLIYSSIAMLMLITQNAMALDEASPFSKIPVGSTLSLNDTVVIEPERAGVHIQNGTVLPFSQIDKFRANCDFEVRTLAQQPTKIQPDTFIITKVVLEEDVAASSWNVFAGGSGDGGPSHVDFSTILYLESVNQPDVLRITCEHWEDPVEAEFLSIKQIRQAMGGLLTLQIK